jgi:lipoyl(octanoyl) transferase
VLLRWAIWPRLSYDAARALETRLIAARRGGTTDLAIVTEHEPVITLGRRAGFDELLLPVEELGRRGIAVRQAERGGLATYHGPGQLVLYPVVALRGVGVRRFVALLEEAALMVVTAAGLSGARRAGRPGVWVGESKVAAVGVRVQHGLTSHGLAINLDGDTTPFTWIRPCGITDGMTASLAALGGRRLTFPEVARIAVARLAAGLGARPEECPHAALDPRASERRSPDPHPQPSRGAERLR